MRGLPDLGSRGEGWVVLQGILLVAIAAIAFLPAAWSGAGRLVGLVLGAGLIAIGATLGLLAQRDLGHSLTAMPRPRDGATLVMTGVYARARHPIYGGLVLAAAGWSLVWASPVGILLAAALLGFFTLKSTREEAWLVERYPAYQAYRTRTRRFVPFVL